MNPPRTSWYFLLTVLLAIPMLAQAPQNLAGDWQGSLNTGAGTLPLVLHLNAVDNKLTATLDSPAQGAYGLAGSNTQLSGAKLSFEVPSVHGSYSGTVSSDGKTITGTWNQGQPLKLVFKLAATDTESAQVKASPIDGDWTGTLHAGDISLRLVFHFHAAPGGKISCSLDSLDQGALGIACSDVKLSGQKLTLEVPSVHGSYYGTLSSDGTQLSGTWSQGQPLPLYLTRQPKPENTALLAATPAAPPVPLKNLQPVLDKEFAPVLAAWP